MTSTEQSTATHADYEKTIRVNADPGALFEALTTTSGLSAWWVRATGTGTAGGEIQFFMDAPEPLVVRVDEATPTSVQWTVLDCPLPDRLGRNPSDLHHRLP